MVATKHGKPVAPNNLDDTLERLITNAEVPRLTSHGLHKTAATHMVADAENIGEIRAAADMLGHSPEMMMRTYTRALSQSLKTVTDKIERRATRRAAS